MNSLVSFPYVSGMTNLALNTYYEKMYTFDVTNTDNSASISMYFVRLGKMVFCNIFGFRIETGAITVETEAIDFDIYDISNDLANPIDNVFLFKYDEANANLYSTNKFISCPTRKDKSATLTDDTPTYVKFNIDGSIKLCHGNLNFNKIDISGFDNNATYVSGGASLSWVTGN